MFLRKLISGAVIISASVGSSIVMGAGAQDVLRINTEGLEQGSSVVLVPQAPTDRLAELHTNLFGVFLLFEQLSLKVLVDDDLLKRKAADLDQKSAQKAELKAQQKAQRQALRRVTKSFKPSSNSSHQH